MADALLLGGQRAMPHKATAEGYSFQFSQLVPALKEIYGQPDSGLQAPGVRM
jgi:NAD dependent epimerase/dehydratase family enzyme